MKKNYTSIVILAVMVIAVCIIYTSSSVKNTPNSVTVYERIMQNDFETNYPSSPNQVIEKNDEIVSYLYSLEIKEEEISKVIHLQRQLFAKELLEANEEVMQIAGIKQEINSNAKEEIRIVKIESEVPLYDDNDTSVCTVKQTIYFTKNGKITRDYTLVKDDSGKWKIFNWKDTK